MCCARSCGAPCECAADRAGRALICIELTGFVAELMRPAYPELMESVQRVARVVKDEEHRYATTFLVAEKVFQDEVKSLQRRTCCRARRRSSSTIPYGLALDEQEEMARERGSHRSRGFTAEMEKPAERARASWKGAEKGAVAAVYQSCC